MGGNGVVATQKKSRAKKKDERYTPDCATALIVPYLPKGATIWEAAWGKGHMARYLQSQGYTVVGKPKMNFLTADPPRHDIICTNPPFCRARPEREPLSRQKGAGSVVVRWGAK
jgi:hypothetical protein